MRSNEKGFGPYSDPPEEPSPEQFINRVASRYNKYTGVEQQLQALAPHVLFKSHEILSLANSANLSFPSVSLLARTVDSDQVFKVNALLDSGATGLYLDKRFVERHNITTRALPVPMRVYNADGTHNSNGVITHEAQLVFTVQGHTSKEWFYVVDLGGKSMIVGMNWLRDHNPSIDWTTGQLEFKRCPSSCGGMTKLIGNIHNLIDESEEFSDNEQVVTELRHDILAYQTMATKLATESFNKDQRPTLDQILKGPYGDFADVFGEEGLSELPPRRSWDHAIDLEPNWQSKKWKQRIYPLNPKEQAELDTYLKEGLEKGHLQPSKSEMASPFFFVAKKGGELRPIVDYRKLNDITVKNKYPLPLIPELVDKWKGCKYFTKLDVRGAFNNIRIKEGDEWKTAFITNRGLYETLVMNFGMVNAPATFQTMMNDIFIVYVRRGDTSVYVDDVIIGTRSDLTGKLDDLKFHEKTVREILEVFRENQLHLKPEKCEFSKKQVEYLGFVITGEKVMMDPIKVDGVKSWPTPTNLKTLRSFIGFINFYRRFVQDFSRIARPLHDLTKDGVKWEWKTEHQEAFDKLKQIVCSSPVLCHPDPEKPFLVETDASKVAMGAVLSQKQSDDKWHPVAFMSKSFDEAQRKYEIHDQELLAIIMALKEWRHFLCGAKYKTEILTDHNNLLYFRNAQQLKPRQARWALYLEEFDINLQHRAGKLSGKPDALSRRADHGTNIPETKDQILLPDQLFEKINMIELRSEFDVAIYEDQHKDPLIHDLMKKREGEVTGWDQQEGLWRFHGKIYVPENLRREVFDSHHASPTAGHPGIKASIDAICRYYFWPNIKDDIETRVRNTGCAASFLWYNFSKKSGKK